MQSHGDLIIEYLPKSKSKKLDNHEIIPIFTGSNRERLSNSADDYYHLGALLPEAIRKGGFLSYLAAQGRKGEL